MAHDSDIDSWDLKQADLRIHTFFRNDPRTGTIGCVTNEYQSPGSRSNDYSHCTSSHATRSGSDVTFINPAIFAESPDANQVSAPRTTIHTNCGSSGTLAGQLSSLSLSCKSNDHHHAGDQLMGRKTYRCQSSVSPPTPSTLVSSRVDSKSSARVRYCTLGKPDTLEQGTNVSDRLEVHRYALNGTRVVECSAASSSNLSDCGGSTSRLIQSKTKAYEEWVEKKRSTELRRKEEARRIEQEKQADEERLAKEREEREKENFEQWSERKKKEEASKREAMERELEFERRLKDVEDKAVVAKTIYLRQWARKKEEQQKALQKKQEIKKKREDEERIKRLKESEKAYEKWRETSKNRPRPATQGLLPHQKATPSYINPNPWVTDNDESG